MAFVNEYVPESDVKKYALDEIWLKYYPELKNVPGGFRHYWTIDRERDIYFRRIATGREELSNRITFNLYWRGVLFEIQLDVADGSSKSFSEQPFRILWELVGIWPSKLETPTRDQVIDVLKEALGAFGANGILRQVPNTVVELSGF